jgi:hypothetical protein
MDFNHLVFVIHGEKPDYPIPAGGYKNGQKSKDIVFDPISGIEFPSPILTSSFDKQEGDNVLINISNGSGVSFYGEVVSEENNLLEKSTSWVNIPPFSHQKIYLKIKKQPFIAKIDSQVIIHVNGSRLETGFTLGSSTSKAFVYSGIGGILAIIAIYTGYLYLRRRKQKTSIYR